MKLILLSTVCVCAAIVLAGCGGGGGGCGVADTCGGDVVGSWSIAGTCLSQTASGSDVIPNCPAASISILDLQFNGTMQYRADLTYTTQVTGSFTERMILPLECLNTTCAQVNATAQADPSLSSASCAAWGTACVCVLSVAPVSAAENGSYTTSGGVMSHAPTTGAPEQDNYCIKGDTMTLATTMGMLGVMGMQAAGTLTLVKQP